MEIKKTETLFSLLEKLKDSGKTSEDIKEEVENIKRQIEELCSSKKRGKEDEEDKKDKKEKDLELESLIEGYLKEENFEEIKKLVQEFLKDKKFEKCEIIRRKLRGER